MQVLVGEGSGPAIEGKLRPHGWGRLWIARHRAIVTYQGEPWGIDNGAYRDFLEGRPFDADSFMRVLDKASRIDQPPMMAVLPDIVAGGARSLELSMDWLAKSLPAFPWYLAVQNGIEPSSLGEIPIQGIFLGGDNAYKARAAEWVKYAHSRGLSFHYGRCGTIRKVDHARRVGADSIDSAFPMWTKERWRAFQSRVLYGNPQMSLSLDAGEFPDRQWTLP